MPRVDHDGVESSIVFKRLADEMIDVDRIRQIPLKSQSIDFLGDIMDGFTPTHEGELKTIPR